MNASSAWSKADQPDVVTQRASVSTSDCLSTLVNFRAMPSGFNRAAREKAKGLRCAKGTVYGLLSTIGCIDHAVKGHALGRKALLELTTIVTPDTILRWHRELVAKKWDHSDKRKAVGRPRIRQVIVDSILRFARENQTWGYDRIQGALADVGYRISDSTVANVLKAHGIEPAPDRSRSQSWSTFLKAHWDSIFATDFTTVEAWTRSGLVTFYVMAVMHLKTRRVHIAGIRRKNKNRGSDS